jgi:acetylornithine deacetylase/succinyl-diaminopimelate desuccinylase-like protein
VSQVATEVLPNTPIVAVMGTGASDSRFLRAAGVAAYGFTVAPATADDLQRMHGHDERVNVAWLKPGYQLFDRLVRALAQ